jgi:hypothetical protein
MPICLWRWNRQCVPKRRHTKFRRWGITQKKTYNIQNTAKVWNQEYDVTYFNIIFCISLGLCTVRKWVKIKVKCTLVQALRLCTDRTANRGSRGITLPFHDDTRRGEGSASSPGRFLPREKIRFPLYRRLSGPQGPSGQVRKISPPPGFDPRTVQHVASRYTDYATRPTRNLVQSDDCMRCYRTVYVFCMLDRVRLWPDLCCEEYTSWFVVSVSVTELG